MNDLSQKKILRIKNIYQIAKIQIEARKCDDILNGKAKLSLPKDKLREKLDEQAGLNARIRETMVKLKEDYSQYSNVLDLLLEIDQ